MKVGDWSAVAADVDTDGDPDVVTFNRGNGEIRWYENLATATAPTEGPSQRPCGPWSRNVVGDLGPG